MIYAESLFGEDIQPIDYDNRSQYVLKKLKTQAQIQEMPIEKVVKQTDISFGDKLPLIRENVYKILGSYADQTVCIYNLKELHDYITAAIKNGVIQIDTETIGTRDDIEKQATDPFTNKLQGLCLYTPGQKNAYIPINHVNWETGERLPNQLTEEQVSGELKRLIDSETINIFQNGKFDYLTLWFNTEVKVSISWDTMIGSQLLNENELAGLKFQYADKVDPNEEKYSIEKLFSMEDMAKYPPELFALYQATDPYKTYRLYEYQKSEFEKPGCERLYKLFKEIEMPVTMVTAEMELYGVQVDKKFQERMSRKFHIKLDQLNQVIDEEMKKYKDIISSWRMTPEANYKPEQGGKTGKSLSEKLSDPIELTSPIQLGILLYDVLKVLKLKRDGKKVTDEAALLSIKDKLPLAEMILTKREYEKFLGTYIDALPKYCSPRDGRLHAHFNQMGREDGNVVTGRMSSSDPNLQNIPARGDITSVRCMFIASTKYFDVEEKDKTYQIPITDEVKLYDGKFKWQYDLKPEEKLHTGEIIKSVEVLEDSVIINIY